MSRNIPIFVEPGYDSTFKESRRSSEPDTGHFDTRHHRHPRFNDTDRLQEEFEDASNQFFEKNFRRRHTDFPDPTFWERDFRSDSPPRYQERPFRRGSNPSNFRSSLGRRARFDEMIGRMMREDSDSFDFWDPEYGNFHVERTPRNRHSPENARKGHERVTKSPSTPISGEKNKGKFDRQSSSPSTSTTVDNEGFVDIPVVVCKDEKTIEKAGKDEREKPETGEAKIISVTQEDAKEEVNTEGTGNQKFEKEKESENDQELTVKISVDSTEEKSDKDKEEKDSKKKDVERQENVKSEKSVNEQSQVSQESQQTSQLPQESQQTAKMAQESQQTVQRPQESQRTAQIPQESQQTAQTPKESQQNAEILKGTQETTEVPRESQRNAETPKESQQNNQLLKIKTIEDQLNEVAEKVKVFKPNGSKENNKEYLWLEEMLMRILMGLDAIEANGNKEIRGARKEVVKRVQIALNELETKSPEAKNKS